MKYMLGLACCFFLAACGVSPEPSFYTLDAVPGSSISQDVVTVKIERPALAAYLDRTQIVRQTGDKRVTIDEMKDWAEPLDRMIERILAEDMQSRIPQALIVTEADAIPADARFIIESDIDQFNSIGDAEVVLTGEWIIKDRLNNNQVWHRPFAYRADGGRITNNMVNGLSELIGQLADDIAAQLHNLAAPHETR